MQLERNLYRIASKYLNDATQWQRIADMNNLADPMVVEMTSLLIPDIKQPNPTEGE